MRVKSAPLGFHTGGTLSPQTLNENLGHMAQAIDDVAAYRYVHSVIRLPYHRSASTPYTHADSDDVREYVLNLPTRWSIERAYLRYYGTAADTVRIDVYEGGALVEEGLLSIEAITPAGAVSAFSGKRLECQPSTEYAFRLEGAGAFSSEWTFLELHIRADRYNTDGTDDTPTYAPARIRASDPRDADVISAELDAIDDEVDKIEADPTWTKVEVYVQHDLDGTNDVTWVLPEVDSDETTRTLVEMRAVAVLEGTPGGSSSALWYLGTDKTDYFLTLNSSTADVLEDTTGPIEDSIAEASADLSDPSQRAELILAHVGAGPFAKTYAVLIYS